MLRRDDDDMEEEEGEGWLASYSDLITDLLAVFVLLFSFALLAQGISKQAPSADLTVLEGGTGVLLAGDSIVSRSKSENSEIEKLIKDLEDQIAQAGLEGQIDIDRLAENRFVMRIKDSILFESGKAVLKPDFAPILDNMAGILNEHADALLAIDVEGHTDNLPISNPQFPSNWELSTGRAGAVVRFLVETSGLDPVKFSSSGHAEYRPIADNDTVEGRALNRRVEVAIELNQAPEEA